VPLHTTLDWTCFTGSGPGPVTGFVVFNTTGKPGTAKDLIGEISVKRAAPNATYNVQVAQAPTICGVPAGTLTTNSQGNGNAHFKVPRAPGSTDFSIFLLGPTLIASDIAVIPD
jgi:hypothetical protein